MKRFLFFTLLLAMAMGVQAQNSKKVLVAYFSWSGSTKALAEEIQRQTGADIYRIEPLTPYTTDYQTLAYQISNQEKADNARPALKDVLSTLNDYDYIFVGCPVWWFDAPMIIHSFLECPSYDFSGKTIIPFCTYATDTYQTLNDIINATPNSEHLEGFGTRGSQNYNSATIKSWLDRIGMSANTSAIKNVKVDNDGAEEVYALNGARVGSSENVPAGVYISNGQKKIVK